MLYAYPKSAKDNLSKAGLADLLKDKWVKRLLVEKFNVYEGIMEGIKEAVAYQQGDCLACKVSVPKFKA